MIELIPAHPNTNIAEFPDEPVKSVLEGTLQYYDVIGFHEPWISYLAKNGGSYVGICSFKGKPANNKVELAYFTFPDYENKGYGTLMCQALIDIALPYNVAITARTLPEENASTAILKK